MNNADDSTPPKKSLPEHPDLGPEPDWLVDEDVQGPPAEPAVQSSHPEGEPESVTADPEDEPGRTVEEPAVTPDPPPPPPQHEIATTIEFESDPGPGALQAAEDAASSPTEKQGHPWIWGLTPFVLLLATGLIAWFGTAQTLNDLATWDAIRAQQPPLLPARWAMTTWWLVLPLMMVFLVYGSLPVGRAVTRIKITGPLISIGLAATALWIFAQHWQWDVIGIASMGIAALSMLATYLLVALGPAIQNIRQRMIAMIPLSAALGYSVMLTVLAWQSYSSQPFGERGSSVLFALLLVVIAAVFAFFLRDGLFALVLAIWFAGVVHQQWGEDAVISLIAAVAALFTVALAVLGTILATESHKPSLTTSVEHRRGRTSFFSRSSDSTSQ